jgi:hypothetical protein
MKRIAALLILMACAQAHAQIQTWSLQGAQLNADDGEYALIVGPAGSLTGHFDYDTSSHTITSFQLNAGGAIFSSHTAQQDDCELTPCTGTASVQSPTTLVFDQRLTPAADARLELFLSAPLDGANGAIALGAQSVLYYNYGLATMHVLGGSLAFPTSAISTPEPASYAMLLFGLGIVAVAGRRTRASALRIAGAQTA